MSEGDDRPRKKMPPSGKKSPMRVRAEELLSDGEWHNFERVVSQVSRLVPPGQAARRAEIMRQYGGKARGPARRVVPRELDHQIRSGARAIVKDILRDEIFEIDLPGRLDDPSIRRVRMILQEDEPLSHADFTDRQLRVLQLTAAGFSSLDVARRMNLRAETAAVNGARSTLFTLMTKFEVNTAAEVVYRARELGILPPAPELSGIDLRLAELLIEFRTTQGPYLAEKLEVDYVVFDQVRRRLYGRYGVNTMVLLREALIEQGITAKAKRDHQRRRAVALYQESTGVREVAATMGLGYGTVYQLLSEAGALRSRPGKMVESEDDDSSDA